VLDHVRSHPSLVVERLTVQRPGDHDNVYFLGSGDRLDVVQVDTRVNGQPSLLMDAAQRYTTSDPCTAAAVIVRCLGDQA